MSAEPCLKEWLIPKLQSLNFDEEVFADYILCILTGEESQSEKRDNLISILDAASDCNVTVFCDEIFEEWDKIQKKFARETGELGNEQEKIDSKLANMLEKQARSVITVNKSSASEKQLKEAILAQYAQVSDDEDAQTPFEEAKTSSVNSCLTAAIPENSNVTTVINAEKESREKAKTEFEKKKTQDKLNKEKQKQKQQERREKERKRTQKGERRR